MPIDFRQGIDSEEKRFLAGILIISISKLMKRTLADNMADKVKKSVYLDSEIYRDKEKMGRYEALRQRGMGMIGAPNEWEELELEEYEVVCDLLTRFDFVREVMES